MWSIEPISPKHEISQFACTEPALNAWLANHALANHQHKLSYTHVAVKPGDVRVYGYYALSAFIVNPADVPDSKKEKIPQRNFQVPCTLMGRLAVDASMEKQGLGSTLLGHALKTALHSSQGVAAFAVVVHAKNDGAKRWYVKRDFVQLLDDPLHLFLSMKKVEALYAKAPAASAPSTAAAPVVGPAAAFNRPPDPSA